MSSRERMLALLALGMIFLVGGGVLGYQFYLRPMHSMELRMQGLQDELAKDERTLDDLKTSMPRLKQMKKLSLPADVVLARREYNGELHKLLRASEFTDGSFQVTSKDPETRANVPVSKRPPFMRLQFDIQARGELSNVVDFLDRFYRTPLLHRVSRLTVVRPITVTRQQRANDLDVNITIEALIVDGAENRKTLLPEGVGKVAKLARTTTQYTSISGRNIFFGPPPAAPTVAKEPKNDDPIAEYIVLDEITHSDSGAIATLYDAYNNRKYEIREKATGKFEVACYYYVKGAKKAYPGYGNKELNLLDDRGEAIDTYNIARIDAADLILEYEGDYYRMHIGRRVSDIGNPLSKTVAKALGLPVKEDKPDVKKVEAPKEIGKKEEVKKEEKPATKDEKKPVSAVDGR